MNGLPRRGEIGWGGFSVARDPEIVEGIDGAAQRAERCLRGSELSQPEYAAWQSSVLTVVVLVVVPGVRRLPGDRAGIVGSG